jgi:hypothetical protein
MQIWCGRDGEAQFGHLTTATGAAFQWARRWCCFWCDVFFLGTAMGYSFSPQFTELVIIT